ncbi:MAG TPA: TonB-dependent receptor [Chitinophagaceae bacterium]
MKFKIIYTIIISFIFSGTFAQTLKGHVFDASTKAPLPGATISFAKSGTTTDNEGMFSINCNKPSAIAVSFIGYETYRIAVKNCNDELSIGLVPVSHNLDAVEITATSNENKSILYQPSSFTKLATPELKRSTGLFLDDAINGNIAGVIMQRRAVSSGQSFNIRGYGNGSGGTGRINSNFDGQGYKVYLNGIPITDAEGITLMDDIDFGSVGNVEVTKGPAGTLYGLAIAGVVNLKTITPEKEKVSLGQDVLIGSYGLQRYTTHFEKAGEHSSLLINYGHQKTDGYTIHNASKKDFVNVAAEFRSNAKESISTFLGYSHSYDERSGELTIAQYNANDFSGNPEYIKRNGHSEITSFRAGASHTYTFAKQLSNTTTVFGSGVSNNSSSAAGWTDKNPVNYGFRSTFDTKFSLSNAVSLSGITGVEMQRQTAQTVGYTMIKNPADPNAAWTYGSSPYWIIGASTSNKYTTSSTASYFTEWTLGMPKGFSITGGIGYSTMRIHLNDRFYVANGLPATFDTSYQGMFSPHFAINKVFNEMFSVYASYSKGYKAPTSSYFYIPSTGAIVPGLKPEIGNQYEVGTKGSLLNNKLFYQVALFDAMFSNKMTAINVLNTAGTATLYTYVANSGKQDDKGIEALVKWNAFQSSNGFIKSIAPFANLTYSDFKYDTYSFHYKGVVQKDSVVNYDGKAVAGVATIVANVGFDIATQPGLYANMTYFYKDGFPVTSDGKNNTASYSLLNAKLGFLHSLSTHFDVNLYVGVNNIGNTKYPIAVFVNQIPDAYLVGPVKANYYGGINLKYNF